MQSYFKKVIAIMTGFIFMLSAHNAIIAKTERPILVLSAMIK